MPASFFFNDTATTEIYTLSLHDALPISQIEDRPARLGRPGGRAPGGGHLRPARGVAARSLTRDRKSTRLNSSHSQISYAVFCLKKKIHAQERAGDDASYAGLAAGGSAAR